MRAHPRSRGENLVHASRFQRCWGSSPLTRGKHQGGGRRRRRMGLIPAHAGKTPWTASSWTRPQAHPRSRGENVNTITAARAIEGSSPLTRGKRRHPPARRDHGRLIPAHAGKTGDRYQDAHPPGAHPRSRGENHRGGLRSIAAGGSSPLTRGKRLARRVRC